MSAKKTVLLVDDEESILFSLQRILELSGDYEIITAQNGREALRKMRNFIPDMIISDILMPEMDGIDFCKAVRGNEVTQNVPFLFLTAKKELMVDGFKVGGDDFIIKPFTFDEVIVKIEAMFRRLRNTRAQASQIKGDLGEQNLDDILQMCHEESITGTLHLQSQGKVGTITLERGEITGISFADLPDDEALDILRTWDTGLFVIKTSEIKIQPSFKREGGQPTKEALIDEPVEIGDNTYWVGYRNPQSLLQINVYLRRYWKEGKVINYLIDPGSPLDFPIISKKIARLIGNLTNIQLYSLNNPDPDVCMNATFIRTANSKAICLTTEENWRMISHYEIHPKSVKLLHSFKNGRMKLVTGHLIQFIEAPFCHARGAFMTYDHQTRILFTGDLFSGISHSSRLDRLYADEAEWAGIREFHQIYMPSNSALRHAVEQIRKLDPQPLMIAPQHGHLLRGEVMERFLERIMNLDVGMDLLALDVSPAEMNHYLRACNELITSALSQIPVDRIDEKIRNHPRLLTLCEVHEGKINRIFNRPRSVFENLALALCEGEDSQLVNQIKSEAMKIAHDRTLPAPELGWDRDQTMINIPANLFKGDDNFSQ